MFPTITQNDINWAFEKYLWKKEFKFKKLASILTMLFMLPLQLWAIKIIEIGEKRVWKTKIQIIQI